MVKKKKAPKKTLVKRISKKNKKTTFDYTPWLVSFLLIGILIGSLYFVFTLKIFDTPLARVNGVEIMKSEVTSTKALLEKQYQQEIEEKIVLEQLISQKLLLDEAKNREYILSKDEAINQLILSLESQNSSLEQFKQELTTQQTSFDKVIDYYIEQTGMNSLTLELTSNITVSEEDVSLFYEENPSFFVQENKTVSLEDSFEEIELFLMESIARQRMSEFVNELRLDAEIIIYD